MTVSTSIYPWQVQQWQQLLQRFKTATMPQALLLQGPKGMGKFSYALNLASLLLCDHPNDHACGHCAACHLLQTNNHPDLIIIKPEEDKKIIKIQQIRDLVEQLQQTPQQGKYQVAIIVPADGMNIAAANALLKTLEEPAGHVCIILLSHQAAMLPATLRSRCQVINFTPAQQQTEIAAWFRQQFPNEVSSHALLKVAEGAPLAAVMLKENQQLEHQYAILENLINLLQQSAEPIKVAHALASESIEEILSILNYLLLDLLKLKLSASEHYIYCDRQVATLKLIAAKISAVKILQLQTQVNQYLLNLVKNLNLNSELILDNLFIALQQQPNRLNNQSH